MCMVQSLTTCTLIFHHNKVNPDDLRVTDLYSDFRADRLMLAMQYLRHVDAPTPTKAGTMAFFGIMLVARIAHESLYELV